MEITQFTYFQQMTGIECKPVPVELTYDWRGCVCLYKENNVFDLDWNNEGVKYKEFFFRPKRIFAYNFEYANTESLLKNFELTEKNVISSKKFVSSRLRPSLKASHIFNLLDARGVIGVAERTGYITRIRELAKGCGSLWLSSQK